MTLITDISAGPPYVLIFWVRLQRIEKNMDLYIFVIYIFVCLSHCYSSNSKHPEARLHEDMLDGINPFVRPVLDITKPVNVTVHLYLISIIGLSERERVMSSLIWLDLRWFDEQLGWNTSKYDGIKSSRVSLNHIWHPDILFRNEIGNKRGLKDTDFVDPIVLSTGEVAWWPGKEVRTKCEIDTTKYPFDEQECKLAVGKWYSDDSKIRIIPAFPKPDITYYEESEQWYLMDTNVKIDIRLESHLEFSRIFYIVKLKRRSTFFIMNVIMPVLCLSFLNQLCFVLPLESGEKTGMCMAIFLTFAVFLSLIGNSLPQSSINMPAYCVYLVFQTILSILTISFEVIILRLYNNPYWYDSKFSRIASFLAPLLGIQLLNEISKNDDDNAVLDKSKLLTEAICRKVALKLDSVIGWVLFACNLAFTISFFVFVNT